MFMNDAKRKLVSPGSFLSDLKGLLMPTSRKKAAIFTIKLGIVSERNAPEKLLVSWKIRKPVQIKQKSYLCKNDSNRFP